MIHHHLLHTIKRNRQQVSFIHPYYGRYSVAEIPNTILSRFGAPTNRPTFPADMTKLWDEKTKRALLLFVDGFGYNHFIDYERTFPFFRKLARKGDVYPITTVFPSTTPAGLTTFHTGLTPQEHGLPEWTVYFDEIDRIVYGTLPEESGTPGMLYEGQTVYQSLAEVGIPSYVFINSAYASSPYSRSTQAGATVIGFTNPEQLCEQIAEVLKNGPNPAYLFVYWNEVDSIEHTFGPRSQEHIEALGRLSSLLEENLLPKLDAPSVEDVLFMISSDHGQASIQGEDIIYLNRYLELESGYRRNRSQKSIYPTGAPHDVFLNMDEAKIRPTLDLLRSELCDKADVLTNHEAVDLGLFGINQPSERFMRRIGNILILPYEGYHVWYKHMPDFTWGQLGIHGGLSQEEMIVPFGIARLSDLF